MTIVPTPVIPRVPGRKTPTDYDQFRTAHPAFMAELQLHRQHRNREIAKLSALPERERHARARKLLRDRRLHLCYAFDAIRKTGQLGVSTPDQIRALALECNPFEICRETTRIFWVPGRHRDRRVVSFGPRRRMQQALVARIIRALHPPLDSQKLFHGGMPSALGAVEAAINEGYDYGVEVDVIHFYASVRPTGLAELLRPLPRAVVEHVIWDTGVRRDPDSDFVSMVSLDDPSLNGLVGLAPGAATSPIVGEKVMSQLLTARRATKLIAYADNIFVLGRGRGAVLSCLEHLRETAEKLPTGALRLRIGDVHHLRAINPTTKFPERFSFLHHAGEVVHGETPDCPVNLCWSPDERKLDEYRLSEQDAPPTLEQIDRIEKKVSLWRRAYPSWPDGDVWELRYLAELAALRFYQSAEPLHKSHAAHQAILCYFAMDRHVDFAEFIPDFRNRREMRRRDELIKAARKRLETMEARRNGRRDWLGAPPA
jgi:hypothetical protein